MSTPISARPDQTFVGPEPLLETPAVADASIDVDSYLRAINERVAQLAASDKVQLERELPKVTIDDGRKTERDDQNLISKITYPGREKTREITRADEKGQPLEIVTTSAEGKSTLVNRDGKWFAKFQGMEFALPGNGGVRFDRVTGDFRYELGTPGLWQLERADGTVTQEKENADGSIVTLNDRGGVGTISRRDRSFVSQTDANTIVETSVTGQSIEWKQQAGGDWVCTQNPNLHRKNFKLDASGVVSYDTPEGDNFRIGGDGSVCQQGQGKAKFTFDDHNRITRIEWPGLDQVRDFSYFGDSKDIKSITVTDKKRGTTYINERADAKSLHWDVKTPEGYRTQSWYGQAMLSDNGVYSRRYTDSQGRSRDGKWSTIWQDGTETRDDIDEKGNRTAYDSRGRVRFKESDDGSRATYDEAGKLTFVRTRGGDTYQITDSQIRMFNNHTGETVTFTNAGGRWSSDSKNYPGDRLNLAVTERGELSFTTGGDKKYLQGTDGTLAVIGKDNVRVDFKDGEVTGITKGNNHRSFIRENGQVVRVVDTDGKSGEKVVFDAAVQKDATNLHINSEGDFSYATTNGAVIERANFVHLELDKGGNTLLSRAANGSSREFKYVTVGDKQELAQIIDRKPTGEVKEAWTRQANADGTLTNQFLAAPAPGSSKPRVRENLNVCRDGEYEYKVPGDAKLKTAKMGVTIDGADGWLSESVDDARSRLMEVVADKMDEGRRQRLEKMMTEFEKRMADRAMLQVLGGRDQAKVEEATQAAVAGTYDHLAALVVSDKPGAYYDQAMRVKLVENFLFHAQDPSTMDQGANGTCWMQAGHISAMMNHPDSLARLVKEASWGSFRTLNGGERGGGPQTYQFSRRMLSMGYEEQRWTINSALNNGMRSPIGKILDETCSAIGDRRQPNGGNYGGSSGCRNIIYKITGDIMADSSHLVNGSERDTLLLNGAYITYAPGHMRSRHLKRDGDGWVIIQDDQHGEGNDRVISRIRDIRQWVKENGGGRVRRNNWGGNDSPWGPNQPGPDGPYSPYGPCGPDDDDDDWTDGPCPGPGPCPDGDDDEEDFLPRLRRPLLRRLLGRLFRF